MAQSTREDAVASIDPLQTGAAADASRGRESADGRAILRTTRLARCLPSLRPQIAVARTLLDELEDSVPSSPSSIAASAQVIEELKRLGTWVLDAAAVLAEHQDADREEHRQGRE
jgi:hypothetical protein